jgi:hypothetical protein
MLIPHEPNHPRANDFYYKVQLGNLQRLEQPILSLRWRRIIFLHTTWDRFQDATEINDLFVEGGDYVNRLYTTLKDRGIQAERQYHVKEAGVAYHVPLTVLCVNGRVDINPQNFTTHTPSTDQLAQQIEQEIAAKGGLLR